MDLAFELHDLVRTLDRQADRLLRVHQLSYNRYVTLVITAEHPDITGRDLARAVGVSEPAMSKIVRQLLDAGLIDDGSGVGTGNIRRLRVTHTGRRRLDVASRDLGDAVDRVARRLGIDPDGLAHTARALHEELRNDESPTSTKNRS